VKEKITMLTRYGELGASSRHRFYNYLPGLTAIGYEVTISPFFEDEYLRRLYTGRRPNPGALIGAYGRRLAALLRTDARMMVEYELLPYWPWGMEKWFLRGKKYLLNFDDNVWEKYAHSSFLYGKYDALTENAAGVIVANSFLEEKVSQLNPNVLRIPTALDPEPYRHIAGKFPVFTIVWIGTPVTYRYLEQLRPVWQQLATRMDFELLVIARKELSKRALEGVRMRFVDWSPEAETALLGQAHVGVMPLPDDLFARGKSAFKLLQYFAAGIPAVASPIGENRNVIDSGRNGLLAGTPDEWGAALEQLYCDAALRERLADAARLEAEKYSLQAWVPRLAAFMEKSWR